MFDLFCTGIKNMKEFCIQMSISVDVYSYTAAWASFSTPLNVNGPLLWILFMLRSLVPCEAQLFIMFFRFLYEYNVFDTEQKV